MTQSSYELLKDVHRVVARLEDKMDSRMNGVEGRLDMVESKQDNMLGKIGMGVLILSAGISQMFNWAANWIKRL